jgi:hypothetical protein
MVQSRTSHLPSQTAVPLLIADWVRCSEDGGQATERNPQEEEGRLTPPFGVVKISPNKPIGPLESPRLHAKCPKSKNHSKGPWQSAFDDLYLLLLFYNHANSSAASSINPILCHQILQSQHFWGSCWRGRGKKNTTISFHFTSFPPFCLPPCTFDPAAADPAEGGGEGGMEGMEHSLVDW